MKIAVTSSGSGLDAEVDPRFGRCAHFVFVDTESGAVEVAANQSVSAGGGAGVQSAQVVTDHGATAVLTGNCGPNAYRALDAAGIKVIAGVTGTVRDAVEAFKKGGLSATSGPSVDAKFGAGS